MNSLNIYQVARIGLKLLGLYVVLQLVASFTAVASLAPLLVPSGFGVIGSWEIWASCVIFFVQIIGYIILSFFLLARTDRLCGFLVKDFPEELNADAIWAERVKRFAFQLMGLYAVIEWFPQFFQAMITTLRIGIHDEPMVPVLDRFAANWVSLMAPLSGTILGLVLLFKARGLLRLIKRTMPMRDDQAP